MACSNNHIANPTCAAGQCNGTCDNGFADCDANKRSNGCEVQGACGPCGNDCWGAQGCATNAGHCIRFTCRPGSGGANFCNGCLGWKEVSYQQWMNSGYCADVIAKYRTVENVNTKCGAANCCGSSVACAGGDNAWHFWDGANTRYTGPCLGCANDVNCTYWNGTDNSAYTRITVCEHIPVLVGQYNVINGPAWGGNPPTYTCQEACALLFGGIASQYACSTSNANITNTANETCYAVGGCQIKAENYKLSANYNCGVAGCSCSAYTQDNCNGVNYCWK
jgi:hypothetical protein